MTILQLTTIHPNPGVKWEDVQKQIKKACDLARKHGAENVTVTVTMIGGRATNTIGVLSSAEDWTRFGQVQQAVLDDPEMQAVMLEGGQIATWESYVSPDDPGHVTRHVIRDRQPSAGVRCSLSVLPSIA